MWGNWIQTGQGRHRRVEGLDPPPASLFDGLDWRPHGEGEIAVLDQEARDQLAATLRSQNIELDQTPVLVRGNPPNTAWPDLRGDGLVGFVFDLTGSPSTVEGGALLFGDGDGRMMGYRPEAGALTVWEGENPTITSPLPGRAARISLIGSATVSETRD